MEAYKCSRCSNSCHRHQWLCKTNFKLVGTYRLQCLCLWITAGQNSDSCRCSAAQTMTGSVSGSSDSYTDSSSICMAALHAGKINSSGGIIIFRVRAGEASYTGTTSNGVTSTSSGATTLKLQFDEIISVMFPGYKFYKGRFTKVWIIFI